MCDYHAMSAGLLTLQDVDLAGKNDRQALGDHSDVCQRLAGGVGTVRTEPAHPLNFRGLQVEEHLSAGESTIHF